MKTKQSQEYLRFGGIGFFGLEGKEKEKKEGKDKALLSEQSSGLRPVFGPGHVCLSAFSKLSGTFLPSTVESCPGVLRGRCPALPSPSEGLHGCYCLRGRFHFGQWALCSLPPPLGVLWGWPHCLSGLGAVPPGVSLVAGSWGEDGEVGWGVREWHPFPNLCKGIGALRTASVQLVISVTLWNLSPREENSPQKKPKMDGEREKKSHQLNVAGALFMASLLGLPPSCVPGFISSHFQWENSDLKEVK